MWPRIGANVLCLVYENGVCLWEKISVVPFLGMELGPWELLKFVKLCIHRAAWPEVLITGLFPFYNWFFWVLKNKNHMEQSSKHTWLCPLIYKVWLEDQSCWLNRGSSQLRPDKLAPVWPTKDLERLSQQRGPSHNDQDPAERKGSRKVHLDHGYSLRVGILLNSSIISGLFYLGSSFIPFINDLLTYEILKYLSHELLVQRNLL